MRPRSSFDRKAGAGDQGFSLLEVVVASALLGVALVAVMQVLAVARRSQEASRGNLLALMAADRVLQEYAAPGGRTSGTYHGQQGPFAYQVVMAPQFEVSGPNSPKRLLCYLIQVKVSWREGGRSRSLEVATMRTAVLEATIFPGG